MKHESHMPQNVLVPGPGVKSAPKTVDISVTGCCNLECQYCYYADEMTAHSDLPTEQWMTFFQELGGLAVQRVTITGGEAFTRTDLFTLLDGIIANKMRYSILSNGTLITKEIIEQFRVGKRRLRLDSIQVSIDGSCADIHNRSRPKDSFDRAMRGLCLLKEHGFPITVRVTISPYNVDDLENIAHLLLTDVGLPSFSTNEAVQMGTARCFGENILLTQEQRQRASEKLMALNKKYHGRISAQAGPLSRARFFAEIEERLERGETGIPGRGTLSSCSGVFSKMAVLHDGTMVPCNLLPTLTMGVIGVRPLRDAWLYDPAINAVRQRSEIPLRSLSTCSDCRYTGFCAGGCPASVLAKTGQLNVRDPLYCYRIYVGEDNNDEKF
jgi:SynChlorMet cassette radical SAM/SPASM protein ScmE